MSSYLLFVLLNLASQLPLIVTSSTHATHATHTTHNNNILHHSHAKSYKSRKFLNETILGKTKVTVDSFVDVHKITALLKFVKKSRDHFQEFGHYHKMVSMDSLFSPVFSGNTYYARNCTFGIGCTEMADQAVNIILSTQNKYIDDELLNEIENFIHIRNKMIEYVSDVFNTTAHLIKNSGSFHYIPKNSTTIRSIINGSQYIITPHVDFTAFKSYDRPMLLDRSQPHNYYKKFTAMLYLEDIPKTAGGKLIFIDLPNRFKGSEASATVHTDKNGVFQVEGGAFADTDAVYTQIHPSKGKLVVFSALSDVHAVAPYTGQIDRHVFTLHMTDTKGNHDQLHNIVPKIEQEEARHNTATIASTEH